MRAIVLLLAAAFAASPARAATTLDFIASIGVNTHLDSTTSSYGRVRTVLNQLRYIGVNRLRDTVVAMRDLAPFREAMLAGMRFDLIVMGDPGPALPTLRAMAASLLAVEGPNEVNVTEVRFRGLRGAAGAVALQKELYAAVKADPALRQVPVLAFSVAQGGSFAPYGNIAAFADNTNVHAYAENGVPPYWMLQPVIAGVTLAPGRPPVVTEVGNYTMADRKSGVSESVQAKWLLDTLFDNFSHGIAATYVYQLEDGKADPPGTDSEQHYGLFAFDGTPKKAADALHDLTSILRSRAAASTEPPATYALAGLPHYGFHTALSKAPGVTDVVIWAEPEIWDHTTGRETPGREVPVRLSLGHRVRTIRLYDPLRGTEPIRSVPDSATIEIPLTDHPLVAEIVE